MAQDSIKAFEHERTKVFQVEDGLLLYKKDKRLYVPDWFNLRRSLVRECHDTKWAGHQELSVQGPCSRKHYYWPKMRDEIEKYVRACLVCQRDKTEQCLSRGKLEPLPILTRPWESVSMDFIVCLPKVGELGSILVVVDRFSKYGIFIAAPQKCNAETTAHFFVANVVKYWGVPKSIVSDRDPRFTGRFWTELFQLFGT